MVAASAICAAVLIAVLAGCGGGGSTEGGSKGAGKDGKKTGYDLVGVFHRIVGDVGFTLTFKDDGSFEGNAWGDHREKRSGTFRLFMEGVGPRVEMTFRDGGRETWSAIVAEDRVEAVVNPEGDQYTRKL